MEAARRSTASGCIVGVLCLDGTVGRVSGLQLLAAMDGSMDAGEPARTHIFADVVGVGRHRRFAYIL